MRRFYTIAIPDGAELTDEASTAANLSEQGRLDGPAALEQLSQAPTGQQLRGQFRDAEFAALMAAELRELAGSNDMDAIPLFRPRVDAADDGYYTVEQTRRVGPVDPNSEAVQEFDLRVSQKGSRETHWTRVSTDLQDVKSTNPFSGDASNDATDARIAIPDRARKRRWYDPRAGEQTPASDPETVVESEFGALARYKHSAGKDALGSPDAVALVYDLPYEATARVDPTVWDDYGRPKRNGSYDGARVGPASVGAAAVGAVRELVQWQRVFSSTHDWVGSPVIENGRVRLRVDEDAQALRASEWDTDGNTWKPITLDQSAWVPLDVDIRRITQAEIEAQFRFTDGSAEQRLDMVLQRGEPLPLWTEPANASSTPGGLTSMLEPIASDAVEDARPSHGYVDRADLID
jgi:hypothetical protein